MNALVGWIPSSPLTDADASLIQRHFVQRKVQLACRNWPPPVDEEGIIQDVLAHVLRKLDRFDADRGPAGLFLSRIVNQRLSTAYRKHFEQRDRGRGGEREDRPELLIAESYVNTDLRVDLRAFIAELDPADRDFCERLMERPITSVAQELEISRSTAYRRLLSIRDRCEDAGMTIYLE